MIQTLFALNYFAEPPKIVSDIAGTFDVVLDMKLRLPCVAIGTPKPSISWKKDGLEVSLFFTIKNSMKRSSIHLCPYINMYLVAPSQS